MTDEPELPSPAPAPAPPLDDDSAAKAVDEFSFLAKDVNYDGVLSEDEFDEGRSLFDKLADPDRFQRYDVNGDGSVTREEFLAGVERDRLKQIEENLRNAPDFEA
jgi:hypothetical protein